MGMEGTRFFVWIVQRGQKRRINNHPRDHRNFGTGDSEGCKGERYARIATSAPEFAFGGDDGTSCCGASPVSLDPSLPVEASSVNAGSGSPLALISPKAGGYRARPWKWRRHGRLHGIEDGRTERESVGRRHHAGDGLESERDTKTKYGD
jgi:hypothetical protein